MDHTFDKLAGSEGDLTIGELNQCVQAAYASIKMGEPIDVLSMWPRLSKQQKKVAQRIVWAIWPSVAGG